MHLCHPFVCLKIMSQSKSDTCTNSHKHYIQPFPLHQSCANGNIPHPDSPSSVLPLMLHSHSFFTWQANQWCPLCSAPFSECSTLITPAPSTSFNQQWIEMAWKCFTNKKQSRQPTSWDQVSNVTAITHQLILSKASEWLLCHLLQVTLKCYLISKNAMLD